jgi:hypothetical protein
LSEKLNVDVSESGWRDKLGQKMWDLNQLALGYRYGDEKQNLKYFFDDWLRSSRSGGVSCQAAHRLWQQEAFLRR